MVVVTGAVVILAAQGAARGRTGQFEPSRQVVATEHSLAHQQLPPSPYSPATSATVVRGTLRNQGTTASALVRVVVTFNDRSGRPVRRAVGYPRRWRIPAQGTSAFMVATHPDPQIASFTAGIEEERLIAAAPSTPSS